MLKTHLPSKLLLAATLCGAVVFTPHAFAQSKGGGKIVCWLSLIHI
mgnify:CR=1 FL=1